MWSLIICTLNWRYVIYRSKEKAQSSLIISKINTAVSIILTNDMDEPTNSDLVFKAVRLLSQFLHFTHGDGCWSLSPAETGRDDRRVDNPETKKKKGRETTKTEFSYQITHSRK